jgi:predicted O-methyltransferase YrrM
MTQPQPTMVSPEDIADWYAGKSFTADWTSKRFKVWIPLLSDWRGRALNVLEIGSWEGRSALFFLNFLPHCTMTCIDTFQGGEEHTASRKTAADIAQVEHRFDANLAAFSGRVEKIKARSSDALPQLALDGRQFDLAYIDGSHRAADVLSDGLLSWPMMRTGGIVIFDDYLWDMFPDPRERPRPGIDRVLAAIAGQYRTRLDAYQIIIEKI